KDAKTILKIPVLPISYADATPLLKALGGQVAPANWRGALPITYHIGAGPAKVHLLVKSDWTRKPVYDVIATLKGSSDPDQWIVRGNRGEVPAEVGHEHLDPAARDAGLDGARGGRKVRCAAVGQIVTVDGGDDHVPQSEPFDGARDALGLVPIDRLRPPMAHRAEATVSRAHGAEEHHGRRAVAPAFPDVGAMGFLAHRVQAE